MAIDTQNKRRSAMRLGFPVPDGAIVAFDRAMILRNYIPAAATILGPYTIAAKQLFVAGAVAGEVFVAGQVAGQVYTAGAEAGQPLD